MSTIATLPAHVKALGLLPGAPAHITEKSQRIDARVCTRMLCPKCRKRGMAYQALHRGTTYRAFAVCRCGHWEEV